MPERAGREPVARLWRDGDRWCCASVNASWAALVRSEPEALAGEPIGAVLADRLIAEALGRLCDLAALTGTRRSVPVPPVGGVPRRASAEPVPTASGTPPKVEVTLHRAGEGAPSYERMEEMLDAATPELVARFDPSLRVTRVNEAVTLVSGLAAEDIIGRTNAEMGYPASVAELWDEHHQQVFESGRPRVISYELPTVLGTRHYETEVRPVDGDRGEVAFVDVISRDVTSRHLRAHLEADRSHDGRSWVQAMWRRFDPTAASPGVARRTVERWMDDVERVDVRDEVALLLSEVATNAVMHAGTEYYVQAEVVDDGVRIEVRDGMRKLPVRREAGSAGGRGVTLLSSLASRWGAELLRGDGKVVWFEVAGRPPGPTELSEEELLDLWSGELAG